MLINGYAIIFDELFEITQYKGMRFYEVVRRGALDGVDLNNVILTRKHDLDGYIYAISPDNLYLTVDSVGLRFECELDNNENGKKLYREIEQGFLNACSCMFNLNKKVDSEFYNKATRTRYINRINKFFEVCVSSKEAVVYKNTYVEIGGI